MASLNILEALDNLNVLVDVDSIDQIEVTEDAQLVAHLEDKENDYWVKAGADEMTRDAIRETFKSVHEYLVHFYEKARQNQSDAKRLIEGINSVMVLVGEAANRLEREGSVFKKRVIELPEYQELQDFYKNHVIQELFKEFAKAPIIKPVEEEEVEEIAGVHILNDIDLIKRDHLYELFLLKNEAGHDFYTMALARNLKLACDFGQYAGRFVSDDPFVQIKSWEDRALHLFAKRILNSASKELETFYKGMHQFKDVEIVKWTHQSVMALFLAANPRNLLRQFSAKGCYLYFNDFQNFLRNAIHTREYDRLLVYSANHAFFEDVMKLIAKLIQEFFVLGEMPQEAKETVLKLAGKTEGRMSDQLHHAWSHLESAFSEHPYGPVFKALDSVRDQGQRRFDPLLQENIPAIECSFNNGVDLLRMPAPVHQHLIHRAEIADEYKAFLRTTKESHLIINFQDRTSWREHARSEALEELGRHAEFAEQLSVITLAKDTEFYDQGGIYESLNNARDFIQQFAHHLADEKTGYYFPQKIHSKLLPTWVTQMLESVHTIFFQNKQELKRTERLDFITIAYLLIELKVIELVAPSLVTHCSKDGLDAGGCSSAALIAFLKEQKNWKKKEIETFFSIVFVPTMLQRERTPHPERIERLESLLRRLENSGSYLKQLQKLFKSETLNVSLLGG